ncbi:MAG: hypothetical protein OXR68_08165 [Alphaproteobacteria bacterium]|nr:hypothetical protein [Alphaproteobacteria bacterium]MDD9920580.1 hypothetical protein [Alphaproteobacteria bacterium]
MKKLFCAACTVFMTVFVTFVAAEERGNSVVREGLKAVDRSLAKIKKLAPKIKEALGPQLKGIGEDLKKCYQHDKDFDYTLCKLSLSKAIDGFKEGWEKSPKDQKKAFSFYKKNRRAKARCEKVRMWLAENREEVLVLWDFLAKDWQNWSNSYKDLMLTLVNRGASWIASSGRKLTNSQAIVVARRILNNPTQHIKGCGLFNPRTNAFFMAFEERPTLFSEVVVATLAELKNQVETSDGEAVAASVTFMGLLVKVKTGS